MKKRNALLCLLSATTFVLASCGETTIKPTEIVVKSEGNVSTIKVDETLQFNATVLPEGSTQSVTWSVVKIDGEATISETGLLTAKKAGRVEVVAASYEDPELKGKATLTIEAKGPEQILPTEIKLLPATKELKVNETVALGVRVTPENAINTVTFTSSDQTVATVSATGTVKALKAGTAKITATSTVAPTIKGECTITVLEEQGGGETTDPTVDWSKITVSTPKQFVDAEKKTALKVEGKCVATTPVNKGKYGAYLQNGKAGVYLYLTEAQKVEVGKTYLAGGYKDVPYNGIVELTNIEVLEEITKTINVETTTITPEVASEYDTVKDYLYGNVTLGKVTPLELEIKDSKAYSFASTFKGKEVTLRVDPNTCEEGEFAKINAKLDNWMIGASMEVSNLLVTCGGYGGKLSASFNIRRAEDIKVIPLSDAEILEIASTNIAIPNFLNIGDNANDKLATTVEGIEGITVTYTFDGTLIGTDGVVKGGELPTFASFKAKLTKGEATLEKEYKVAVGGTKEMTSVHTFDLEDALPAKDYGCSASKPGYAEGAVKLGNPAATWNLRNTLIASTKDDKKDGEWSMRAQVNKDIDASARIELREDKEFSAFSFSFGTYGSNPLGTKVTLSYSIDGGKTWKEDFVSFKVTQYELETVTVSLPESTANTRIAINLRPGLGKRVNIDNIKLLK